MVNSELPNGAGSGKSTVDTETMRSLRRIAYRLSLRINERVTYREAMAIIESGMDDATLEVFIERYNAANGSQESRA
jgi:hypothetical protein